MVRKRNPREPVPKAKGFPHLVRAAEGTSLEAGR